MYVKIVQPCGEIRSIYEEAAGFMSEREPVRNQI